MPRRPRPLLAGAAAALTGLGAIVAAAGGATASRPALPAPTDPTDLPADYSAFLASVGGSRYVQVDGVWVHYVEAGPADAPTVLLLHGSPDNVFAWRNIMPALADRYHVVAPDLVGFGLSGAPSGTLTWGQEIHYLAGFVHAEHLHRITLASTDIGTLFGAAYAAEHPGDVRGLAMWESITAPIPSYQVLGDTCSYCVGFFQGPKTAPAALAGDTALATQIYGSSASADGYAYFLQTYDERLRVAEIGANMPIGGLTAAEEWPAVLGPSPVDDNLATITGFARYLRTSPVPKLVLYATPGAVLPAAAALAAGMPDTTTEAVGPGAHYLAEQQPQAITAALLGWLAALPATSRQ